MPEYIVEGHSQCIWNLAYLGISGNIMGASDDGSICQWKRDGEPMGTLNSDGGGIASMVVSSDETMVVCGNVDGTLRLWNIEEGSMVGEPWQGHDDTVRCLDWSSDGLEIASGSQDGTIRRWSPYNGRQIASPMEISRGWVMAVKYSPQGDKFMSGGNGPICIWSRDGRLLFEIKGHENAVPSLCWSKDGAHIFSASVDHTIRKWRAIDGQELFIFRGHVNAVLSLCLTPDESYIVSGSADCSIRIWDLETNQAVGDPLFHDDQLRAVVMSRDGKCIASAGPDKKIYVWSLEAALEVVGADDGNAKLKGHPFQSRVVRQPSHPRRDFRIVIETHDRNGTETGATVESSTNSTFPDYTASPAQTRVPSYPLQDLTDELQGRSRYPITSGGFGDIWKCNLVKPDMTVQQ
ncbi:WD40 repeat-like protein [Suillus hirtellus]|nr:WD40 repeat-like protein [Suillus hirtellus]